jgi:Domain of unknown function (DUF4263)
LRGNPEAHEAKFQEFVEKYPVILDLYGEVIPKPRFAYPSGGGPTGKSHVEPDFLVKYPNETYRIVEIERPSKRLATIDGQPRSELTEAAYQLSEFRDYIQHHYDILATEYPGISANCTYSLIVGRTTERTITTQNDPRRYLRVLCQTYSADDILTYDDLLNRASAAQGILASLSRSTGP